ncbi:MAG: ATP-binding protein [Candidatus Dadabacteria bacterium]|nr:MAG: ATP-binding protein [Candidatus Dadabacteria bacterium]
MNIVIRRYWLKRLRELLKQRSIIWLSGVRRVGKTTLVKQLGEIEYFNCDLPSVRRQLKDPESFLSSLSSERIIIFDEIHQVENPTQVLKVAADEFSHLRIVATGSSTLAATKKFRDTLTDRKRNLHLTPILWSECLKDFNVSDLDYRLLRGGLPPALLSNSVDSEFYEEWLDSYFARDVQELFGVRNRAGFLKLLTLIFYRSSGILDVTDLAKESGLSRPTVLSHLDAMEISHTVFLLRPFWGRTEREIKKRPKIYAFDTGFISHIRGWRDIRDEDRGQLWEVLVLDELLQKTPKRNLYYWRNKSGKEVNFIIDRGDAGVDAIEAKVQVDSFNVRNLSAFRELYPKGENYLALPFVKKTYKLKFGELTVKLCRPDEIP